MKKLAIIAIILFAAAGCTENSRAKKWGGTAKYDLPAGKKLVNATWKDDELWLLYRERRANEPIETYHFAEKSSWGIIEGTYIINEK